MWLALSLRAKNKRSPICRSTSRQCVRACSAHSPAGSPDNEPRRAPASCTRRMPAAPASGQISRAQVRRDGRPFAASTGTSPDRDLQASHTAPSRRRHRATPTDRITVSDGEGLGERTPSRLICLLTWSVGIGSDRAQNVEICAVRASLGKIREIRQGSAITGAYALWAVQ